MDLKSIKIQLFCLKNDKEFYLKDKKNLLDSEEKKINQQQLF